jgi:hypothetical protein
MDLVINIFCLLSGPCICYFLSQQIRISDRFWGSVGYTLALGEMYLAARLFHISVVLLPFRDGISWQKPSLLLMLSYIGIICAFIFYIKDRNKSKENGPNQKL